MNSAWMQYGKTVFVIVVRTPWSHLHLIAEPSMRNYIVGAQDLRGFTNQVFKQLGQPRTFGVKAKLTF